MSRFSIEQFIRSTAQQDRGEGLFELESDRMLEANLDGDLWIKTGLHWKHPVFPGTNS